MTQQGKELFPDTSNQSNPVNIFQSNMSYDFGDDVNVSPITAPNIKFNTTNMMPSQQNYSDYQKNYYSNPDKNPATDKKGKSLENFSFGPSNGLNNPSSTTTQDRILAQPRASDLKMDVEAISNLHY